MSVVGAVEEEIIKVLSIYSAYRRAILGEFARFLMTPQALKPGSKPALRAALLEISQPATQRVLEGISVMQDNIAKLLLETALNSEDVSMLSEMDYDVLEEFMSTTIDRMTYAIVGQFSSDIDQIVETYSRFLVRVYQNSRNSGSRQVAASEERNRVMQNVDLYHRDALGRRRDSEQFVFTELRYGVYRWFNVSMVYILSKLGYERARIDRPLSHLHQVVIDLDEFESLENQIFHPNAKALIVP